ncbi:MAG: hypothetical protein M3458_21680, partial [Acidobacteriota bacterium]|nr:hypothetical protein [Acidobacteriota bacterium]
MSEAPDKCLDGGKDSIPTALEKSRSSTDLRLFCFRRNWSLVASGLDTLHLEEPMSKKPRKNYTAQEKVAILR